MAMGVHDVAYSSGTPYRYAEVNDTEEHNRPDPWVQPVCGNCPTEETHCTEDRIEGNKHQTKLRFKDSFVGFAHNARDIVSHRTTEQRRYEGEHKR